MSNFELKEKAICGVMFILYTVLIIVVSIRFSIREALRYLCGSLFMVAVLLFVEKTKHCEEPHETLHCAEPREAQHCAEPIIYDVHGVAIPMARAVLYNPLEEENVWRRTEETFDHNRDIPEPVRNWNRITPMMNNERDIDNPWNREHAWKITEETVDHNRDVPVPGSNEITPIMNNERCTDISWNREHIKHMYKVLKRKAKGLFA